MMSVCHPVILLFVLLVAWRVSAQELGKEYLQGNEQQLALQMVELIKKVTAEKAAGGEIKRLNQIKSQGCFNGQFEVLGNIPGTFKHGLFAKPATYPAYARFANASTLDDAEKDLRGLSFSVLGVQGQTIGAEQGRQDFLMNSYPVLFAQSPEVFYQFIEAQYTDSVISFFLNPFDSHLSAMAILLQARDRPTSVFDIQYWSTTAFRLGNKNQAIKYSAKPCSLYQSKVPQEYTNGYLQQAMQQHLQVAPVCFDFMLQLQTDAQSMPVEDPTIEWDEDESAFVKVAQLRFEEQDFLADSAMKQCEQASFNPWQSLPEHQPLGRINAVRKWIYPHMAAFRQQK